MQDDNFLARGKEKMSRHSSPAMTTCYGMPGLKLLGIIDYMTPDIAQVRTRPKLTVCQGVRMLKMYIKN